MRQGKGMILKMFGLQTKNFIQGWVGKRLVNTIVNTIQGLTGMCYITEETGPFIVVVLFVLRVIFIWGNLKFCFFSFQFNDKWVYDFNRNIFIFKFHILFFKIFFSLTTTYDIPFLQIHTTIFLQYLVTLLMSINDE